MYPATPSMEGCAGTDIDDLAVPLLPHLRHNGPTGQPHPFQVDFHQVVPLLGVDLIERQARHRRRHKDGGVVDQDIDAAEFFHSQWSLIRRRTYPMPNWLDTKNRFFYTPAPQVGLPRRPATRPFRSDEPSHHDRLRIQPRAGSILQNEPKY